MGGFANIVIFYYISRLVRLEDSFSPDEYFAFVTIGVLIFTVVTATLTTPHMALRQELVAGTFERLLLAPGGTIASIVSLLLFPALYALLTVMAMLASRLSCSASSCTGRRSRSRCRWRCSRSSRSPRSASCFRRAWSSARRRLRARTT